jgi:tRNA(Ile)-lysidine synthase
MSDPGEALDDLAAVVRDSRLVKPGSRGIVLVSGGPDSAALAAGLARHCGPDGLVALHLNYRLRADSDDDEKTCRELCAALRLDLRVERPPLGGGNVQAAAREARYLAAEQLRERDRADWIATGHTRTDVAETLLYRLATSPGRRALLGLQPRRGRIVRPLLAIGRAEARDLVKTAGLPFRDDPSNKELRYARNRIRLEVLPVLGELNPAVEEAIAATRAELGEEAEALEALAGEALEAAGAGPGAVAIRAEALEGLHPTLRRLALRKLAERVAGREVPLGPERASEIERLAATPEGGRLDLGGGLAAVLEGGMIRIAEGEETPPEPARLPVPGSCRFGLWEVRAEIRPAPVEIDGPDRAALDPATLGEELEVRAWRNGDRMWPLGLTGTKSLQDLFTDSKVPRSLRHTLPLVVARGRIAWVAGVAVSEEFRIEPNAGEAAVLTARVAE